MDNDTQKFQNQTPSDSDKQQQTAVPYIPPPPPDVASVKRMGRSPLMNGVLAALVILLGGFMLYNYVGHSLTHLAGVSSERIVVPTPTSVPSNTPEPTMSVSPSPSPSTVPSPTH